jgi:hypothetical protein
MFRDDIGKVGKQTEYGARMMMSHLDLFLK